MLPPGLQIQTLCLINPAHCAVAFTTRRVQTWVLLVLVDIYLVTYCMGSIQWTFDSGYLFARDGDGGLLWSACVDAEVGSRLAALLNQAPRLSAALLAGSQLPSFA